MQVPAAAIVWDGLWGCRAGALPGSVFPELHAQPCAARRTELAAGLVGLQVGVQTSQDPCADHFMPASTSQQRRVLF